MAERNRRYLSSGAVAALGLAFGYAMAPQRAGAAVITDPMLLQDTTLVYGQQSDVFSLSAPGPGTLEIQLQNLAWPERLQNLSLALFTATKTLGALSSAGEMPVTMAQGGAFSVYVSSQADNTLGLEIGLFSLSVQFVPLGAPVPLPAPVGLLLSGVGLLGGMRLLGSRWITKLLPQRTRSPA